MARPFMVWLGNKRDPDCYAELKLPAMPYEMLDAMEKLRLRENDSINCEIEQYGEIPFMAAPLDQSLDVDIFKLNTLIQKISQLSESEIAAFQGLAAMDIEYDGGPFPLDHMLYLADNIDCCSVHPGINDYEDLGHFYVENGLVPELKDISEQALRYLDYGHIGRILSEGECGLLISGYYVTQTSELREETEVTDHTPHKPDYTILLELIGKDSLTQIPLPASDLVLFEVKNTMTVLWPKDLRDAASIRCSDCAAPSLIPTLSECGVNDLVQMNQLAKRLQTMDPTRLTKYKAVLDAVDEKTVSGAMQIAEHLEEYLFSPQFAGPEDMARDFLASSVGEPGMATLSKFVNLYGYGEALMEKQRCAMTEYGMVSREDGQSLKPSLPSEQKIQDEMTMQMQ